MTIQPIQQKQRQKYLIIIFIIIIIATAAIWWFGFFKKGKPPISSPDIILREIDIDFEVLKSQEMKNFQPFKEIPSFLGQTGRDNPFISY